MNSLQKGSTISALESFFEDKSFYSKNVIENEEKLQEEAEKKALSLFISAAKAIPAYKSFLKDNKFDFNKVKTIEDFKKVPVTTKENYIDKFSIVERCWNGEISKNHMISTSSGTTAEPHLWPRDLISEIDGAYLHEYILSSLCNILDKKTLLIDGFAMGNWIAGTFTYASCQLIAWKGYPLTIMTPGYSSEEIMKILHSVAKEFEQVIITGHTPFLKELVEKAAKEKVFNSKQKMYLLGTGQAITEEWRTYLQKLLGQEGQNETVVNLYGSADAALMGFETPSSMQIRKLLSSDSQKMKKLFKESRLPSLYNFDPRLTFFEEVENQLHVTKNSGCPLIRYNILDDGGVLTHTQLTAHFKKSKKSSDQKLPFVYLFGRDKFMVKIYGANIYSEHVQKALSHSFLQSLLTGRYIMQTDYDGAHNPLLRLRIELNEGISEAKDLTNKIQKIFVEEVKKVNSEYNFVLRALGKKVFPEIILHEHNHPKYFPKGKVKKNA